MTKKELADVIHKRIGLSKRESAEIVDYFFDLAKEELTEGEGLKMPRFGSFRIQERKSRKGRNPATGDSIHISKRKAVVFKPSRFLRDALNKHPIEE